MKIAVFSTKQYDQKFLLAANGAVEHEFNFFEEKLNSNTVFLAQGHDAICCFVNDILTAHVLDQLKAFGIKFIALRCAGFNQVDIRHADSIGIKVTHVPAYSPYAVAEFALTLILALNRKIHRAYKPRARRQFLDRGPAGFRPQRLHDRPCRHWQDRACHGADPLGFGVRVLGYDVFPNKEFGALGKYVDLDTLFAESNIVSLHCPLTPDTYHIVDQHSIAKMKRGVMIINTSRGALVDAPAVIEGSRAARSVISASTCTSRRRMFFTKTSPRRSFRTTCSSASSPSPMSS